MSKHPPRPWIYNSKSPDKVMAGRRIIAIVPNDDDARLIAAAPELYACLDGLLQAFPWATDEDINGGDVIDYICEMLPSFNSAIKKAKGKG